MSVLPENDMKNLSYRVIPCQAAPVELEKQLNAAAAEGYVFVNSFKTFWTEYRPKNDGTGNYPAQQQRECLVLEKQPES